MSSRIQISMILGIYSWNKFPALVVTVVLIENHEYGLPSTTLAVT